MTGSDLADDCDGKLISYMLSPEGAAFSDARYSTYLTTYNHVFGDEPEYSVADDDRSYARVAPALDALYADWVEEGRPVAPPEEHPELDAKFDDLLADAPFDFEALPIGSGPTAVRVDAEGAWHVEQMEMPHEAPDLEALIPDDLVGPGAHRMSSTAADWGSSLLSRALRRLDATPKQCHIASVMSMTEDSMVGATLYRVPGVPASRLENEFGTVIHRPTKQPWRRTTISGRSVWSAAGGELPGGTIAWWAVDGLVVHVFGSPEGVAAAAGVLP
jgi:hypothetical protein